jgi:Cu(I)/Ag(I) efflux system periplasmic protein CusF
MRYLLLACALALAPMPALAQHKHDHETTAVHKGTGVVTKVDKAAGRVTLKHDPIRSLNWPTMTMAFHVKDKAMLDKLAAEQRVEFEFVQQDKRYVITSIH